MAGDEPGTFLGRARPVVLSDLDRALCRDAAHAQQPAHERPSLRSIAVRGAALVLLAVPAMLVVALGIALAAR
jgi:hypothetical protein